MDSTLGAKIAPPAIKSKFCTEYLLTSGWSIIKVNPNVKTGKVGFYQWIQLLS